MIELSIAINYEQTMNKLLKVDKSYKYHIGPTINVCKMHKNDFTLFWLFFTSENDNIDICCDYYRWIMAIRKW